MPTDFKPPIQLNDLDALGRVDVAFLNPNEVLVSYMELDAARNVFKN
jgi:hypothetical protein